MKAPSGKILKKWKPVSQFYSDIFKFLDYAVNLPKNSFVWVEEDVFCPFAPPNVAGYSIAVAAFLREVMGTEAPIFLFNTKSHHEAILFFNERTREDKIGAIVSSVARRYYEKHGDCYVRKNPPSPKPKFPYSNVWLGFSMGYRTEYTHLSRLNEIPMVNVFLNVKNPGYFQWRKMSDSMPSALSCIKWVVASGETTLKNTPHSPLNMISMAEFFRKSGKPFYFEGWGARRPVEEGDNARETGYVQFQSCEEIAVFLRKYPDLKRHAIFDSNGRQITTLTAARHVYDWPAFAYIRDESSLINRVQYEEHPNFDEIDA